MAGFITDMQEKWISVIVLLPANKSKMQGINLSK